MARPGYISAKPLAALLGRTIDEAFARQGFASRQLVTRWAEIAGSEIAEHSQPMKIQWQRPVEGQPQEPATLVLRVEGPMALEIQHSSDVIIERVNRFFGWAAIGRIAAGAARPPRAEAASAAARSGRGRTGRGNARSHRRRGSAGRAGPARRPPKAELPRGGSGKIGGAMPDPAVLR